VGIMMILIRSVTSVSLNASFKAQAFYGELEILKSRWEKFVHTPKEILHIN
jgi:hypothetical protein